MKWGKCSQPMPRNEDEMPPEEPNVYTDGSLHNPTSRHWQVGGMGIFWPDRKLEEQPIEEYENRYMRCEEITHGINMWGTFTALRGSSTRCEIATALVAVLRQKPAHIGTDSLALVRKGTAYLEHLQARRCTKIKEDDGTLILGGRTSHLHRRAPWRQTWQLMKDGDLWDAFGKAADAKNPNAIKLTKVKGHATWQMVKDGTVKPDDRFGNDQSY